MAFTSCSVQGSLLREKHIFQWRYNSKGPYILNYNITTLWCLLYWRDATHHFHTTSGLKTLLLEAANFSYHMSNSHECMGANGEALQLHAVYKNPYFLLQVMWESVSVLQVTWESISGTASHTRCIWMCNEIEGSYDEIIITIAPSYTEKISLVCCRWHCAYE